MRMRPYAVMAAFVLVLLPTAGFAQPLSLNVTASPERIFEGDSLELTVQVNGALNTERPDLSALRDVDFELVGNEPRKSIILRNGIRSTLEEHAFTYRVTPQKAGRQLLGPIQLKAKGRELSHPGVTIEVTSFSDQRDVIVEQHTTSDRVLPGEPFTVTVDILVKALGGQYRQHDPIHPDRPPHVQIPWIGEKFSGLEVADIKQLLEKRLISSRNRPGFRLNNFTVQDDLFSMFSRGPFNSNREAVFMFDRTLAMRNSKPYVRYRFQLPYMPLRTGSFQFEPPVFKGVIIDAVTGGGQIKTASVMTAGKAVQVEVIPPPAAGRPDSFFGAIGTNFTVEAALDTNTCNVGDPLSLTLHVRGDLMYDNLTTPKLWILPALAEDFKIYADSVKSRHDREGSTYTYIIRPQRAGTYELPALELAFYNRDANRYEIRKTAPLPLRAKPVTEVSDAWVLDKGTNVVSRQLVLQRAHIPQAPMTVTPGGASDASMVKLRLHGVAAAAGPLLFLLTIVMQGAVRWSGRHSRQGRRRAAARNAIRALSALPDTPEKAAEAASRILAHYIFRRLDLANPELTPADVANALAQQGLPESAGNAFTGMFETIFNARFSSAASGLDRSVIQQQAQAAVEALENTMSHRPRSFSRPGSTRHLTLFLLMILPACVHARAFRGEPFLWEQANRALAQAQDPTQFEAAAKLYAGLIARGIENGPVFYNYGVSLLQTDRVEDALHAFQRAERYQGRTEDIARNMHVASLKNPDLASADWLRAPLFWHYALAADIRLLVACIAFSLVWVALALRLLRLASFWRNLLMSSAVVCAVFTTSAVSTLHAEHRDREHFTIRYESDTLPPQTIEDSTGTSGGTP